MVRFEISQRPEQISKSANQPDEMSDFLSINQNKVYMCINFLQAATSTHSGNGRVTPAKTKSYNNRA